MRPIAILIVALMPMGCVQRPPPAVDLQPFVAAAGAYSVMAESKPAPPPPPPSRRCGECLGRGTVGDGVVIIKCLACGGDGVVDESTVVHDPVVIQ